MRLVLIYNNLLPVISLYLCTIIISDKLREVNVEMKEEEKKDDSETYCKICDKTWSKAVNVWCLSHIISYISNY